MMNPCDKSATGEELGMADMVTVTCAVCGATGGSFILTERGWLCLEHLPRFGANGRRVFRDAS
jgi:hypothetical protein